MIERSKMLKKIYNKCKRIYYAPRIKVVAGRKPILRLGTAYGGKSFVDRSYLNDCTVFSVGLGEDASFDVEFATRYGARIVIVDPTPRSVAYYKKMISRFGRESECKYGTAGYVPVESYDMSGIERNNLLLVEKALWIESTTLRFFTPKNIEHVSHSIVNFQNDFRIDTPHIDVYSTTLAELLSEFGVDRLSLLKLDIEGAEISVIDDMLDRGILPLQILVEFDELARPSAVVRAKYEALYARLLAHGYTCRAWDGYSDYCFEHTDSCTS